jgi:hypothetical protein
LTWRSNGGALLLREAERDVGVSSFLRGQIARAMFDVATVPSIFTGNLDSLIVAAVLSPDYARR